MLILVKGHMFAYLAEGTLERHFYHFRARKRLPRLVYLA